MRPRKLGISAKTQALYLPRPAPSSGPQFRARLEVIAALTERLVERDGPDCWYCGIETTPETRTIEHLLAQAHGGNDEMANLCIACEPCNLVAAALDIVAKVARRDEFRERLWWQKAEAALADRVAQVDALYQRPQTVRQPSPNALAMIEAARIKAERKAQAQKSYDQRQEVAERRFVNAARSMLDKEIYLSLWRQVEQEAPQAETE